jgi:hypothetical protein
MGVLDRGCGERWIDGSARAGKPENDSNKERCGLCSFICDVLDKALAVTIYIQLKFILRFAEIFGSIFSWHASRT